MDRGLGAVPSTAETSPGDDPPARSPRLHYLAMVGLQLLLHKLCILGSFLGPDGAEGCKGNLESQSPKGVQVLPLPSDPRPGFGLRSVGSGTAWRAAVAAPYMTSLWNRLII
jgi:hypothetical protein